MSKTEIEIKDAYIVNDRLTVITVINGKENYTANYPADMAKDKDALLEQIKNDYDRIKHNMQVNTKKNTINELIGKNKL